MKNSKKFFYAFLLVVFGVALYISLPLSLPLLFGAVITQGILGGGSGKVGPVVMAGWKGIDYVRGYKVPTYSNTPAQQTQREKFTAALVLARQILGSVINPYWDPFAVKSTGWANVMSEFLSTLDGSLKLTTSTKMAKGTLLSTVITTATYATATGALSFLWNGDLQGNQSEDDNVFYVVYDKANNKLYSGVCGITRVEASASETIVSGLTATNLILYVFFIQGTGSEMIIGDSYGKAMVAA